VHVRIVTPLMARLMAKEIVTLPDVAFSLPQSATVQQLHDSAVAHLSQTPPDWMKASATLDLHTHQLAITKSSYPCTLEETGLHECLVDHVLTIYAVPRSALSDMTAPAESTMRSGRNAIYLAGPHWQPIAQQSERGMAMFLSSLRVFTDLLRSDSVEDEHRDRVAFIFDLLTRFPPAVLSLHLLIQGRTISHSASTALAHAVYHVLQDFGHKTLIRNTSGRVFEGARLMFGLVLDKANQLKAGLMAVPEYSAQIKSISLVGASEIEVLLPGEGIPFASPSLSAEQVDTLCLRLDLLSESKQSAVVFLESEEGSAHKQTLRSIIAPEEVQDPGQLAALCAKVSLLVVKPSSLSTIAPEHLTFDQEGHVAVYTGKQGCAMPGEETIIFRPLHGEATPNLGRVEQLLAPTLRTHEQDGTDVLDAQGSSTTRALDAPDEIIVFAVDCSASMGRKADLIGIDADQDPPLLAPLAINPELYNLVDFESTKEAMMRHQVFEDVLGAVVEAQHSNRPHVVEIMLALMLDLVTLELEQALKSNPGIRSSLVNWQISSLEELIAGLKCFEQELGDFIILRSMSLVSDKWMWTYGDGMPGQTRMVDIPGHLTYIPHELRCPITHELLEDPVMAADGHTYSRQAMVKWLQIRRSSPMTNLVLDNTELEPQSEVNDLAHQWLLAKDLQADHREASLISVTFVAASSLFNRRISPRMTVLDLYEMAFRGMRGRHAKFQLSINNNAFAPTVTDAISSLGIVHGSNLDITIDGANTFSQDQGAAPCLIKIYIGVEEAKVSYWVPANTRKTIASIMAKFWRFKLAAYAPSRYERCRIYIGLETFGDNRYQGFIAQNQTPIADYLNKDFATGRLPNEPIWTNAADESDASDTRGAEPQPLVLKVLISGDKDDSADAHTLTRLHVSKQMFEAIINRIIAYAYKTHIGLVTFDNTARVAQTITHVIENFRRSVGSMTAKGDTALWDGIKLAQLEISRYAERFPDAKRRIIVFSDGNDNRSLSGAADLCYQLRNNKILVDSVIIGHDDNVDLKALSGVLHSYCFHPQDLTTALAICEMEPVLSQDERPESAVLIPNRGSVLQYFHRMRHTATFTTVTQDSFPPRRKHPRIWDDFVQLTDCIRLSPVRSIGLPTLRNSRILVEMQMIASNGHPSYDCYISETDMFFWKIVIEGVSLVFFPFHVARY
jgi:Mg-chelatase subunit ChlD